MGDIVLHPRFFAETRKWPSSDSRKTKYASELQLAGTLRAEPNLSVPSDEEKKIRDTVIKTRDSYSLSAGKEDINQLISCIKHEIGLITNDSGLYQLADMFLDNLCTAEKVLLEALSAGVITQVDTKTILTKWKDNGEKRAAPEDEAEFIKNGISMKDGYIV